MAVRKYAAIAVLAGASTLSLVSGCSRADAQNKPQAPEPGPVELTIFTQDFAQVREVRPVNLKEGLTQLSLRGVSKELDPDSVIYDWPNAKEPQIASSTYDLGTSDSSHLLQRFLGKEVTLVYRGENGREGQKQKGILEVASPGNIVVRVGDKYVVNPNATIEAPTDAGIVTIPQLSVEVESPAAQKTDLGVTYLTRGLSWSADYTATLLPNSDQFSLECWASVVNNSGTAFPKAKINFAAGSPNRAAKAKARNQSNDYESRQLPAAEAPADGYAERDYSMKPEATGEMYVYPYQSTATIRPDQTSRVRMMTVGGVNAKRDYAISLPYLGYGYSAYSPGQRLKATLSLNFANDKTSGLGQPLPAGSIRFYEKGKSGAPQYVGAANITDTPTDARVSMTLTNVFDIYATGKVVKVEKVDKKRTRHTIEIKVHNEKATDAKVRLVQEAYATFKMESENFKSIRINTNTPQWVIPVKAGGEETLRFSVVMNNY